VSLRLTGLGEEQRLDVSHLALAPLERLALVITRDPGCEGKSCVRNVLTVLLAVYMCSHIIILL